MAESALRRDLVEGEIGVQKERPRPGQPLPRLGHCLASEREDGEARRDFLQARHVAG